MVISIKPSSVPWSALKGACKIYESFDKAVLSKVLLFSMLLITENIVTNPQMDMQVLAELSMLDLSMLPKFTALWLDLINFDACI